jgi:hypothetical protein
MYEVNYNGFTLSNDDNHTVNVHGLSKIDIRLSSDNLTGRNGGNVWATKYGMRDIKIFGDVYANDFDTYFNLRSELQEAFDTLQGDQELTITIGDRTRKITGTVIEFQELDETPGEFAEAPYYIVVRCGDPFFTDTSISTGGPIEPGVEGGTPVPMPIPSPIGSIGESITIVNSGDLASYAVFTITGTITNPRVQNNSTGKYFQLNTTLNAGQILTVERTNQGESVTVDGANYYQYFEGEVFPIAVGTNVITFNGINYIGSTLTLEYSNKYLTF